ncbi:MAG: helix-turn-helix domain-containing protein [Rikenellaceae bacterium]|nr:helix-turn-helix domain-containing protein [Rikenellaceae bacterium]
MKTEIDIRIIENIKVLRKKRDISQRTLAEMIGVSYGYIGDIERPNSPCKYSAWHRYLIAKNFDCSLYDIFPAIDPLEP